MVSFKGPHRPNAMNRRHILENTHYRVEVESLHGRILRIRDKAGRIELLTEPRLADNFRLLLPLPGLRSNYILGSEQRLSAAEVGDDKMELRWNGPLRNPRGHFPLDVTMRIEFVGEAIHIGCRARNRTKHALSEVWYPILGGMRGFGRGREARNAEVMVPQAYEAWRQKIFSDFGHTRGEALGTLSGEHAFGYPGIMVMPWITFLDAKQDRALYVASHEESPRVRFVRFAQAPGLAADRPAGNSPRESETRGYPSGVTMNWAHFPFTPPGETFEGSTIVLQAHDGGWRKSAAIYRKWFTARFPPVDSRRCWLRQETASLDTMFLLPEDNINVRFREIPRWARTAAEHGLKCVLISGWNIGGHDRGYPQYTPDPSLGTWKELEAGVRACHRLGLRAYFFTNCQPVDMSTAWYRKELHKYRLLDPHGQQFFIINYWGMGTLGARIRFCTATPFSEMNPAHPEVRRLLIRQFRRLAEIGADGVHVDKFFGTPFDFNPRLKGTSPDRAHHEGMLRFVEEMLAECRAINPEFCFSYEGAWDRLIQYTDVSWGGGGDDLLKAIFPQRTGTMGITQPWDHNRVNLAVLNGLNLLVGPGNYMRGMDYPPMKPLCRYIAEVTRIRRGLHGTLSRGEVLDASGGLHQRKEPMLKIKGSFAGSPHAKWRMFRDTDTGTRAVVLVNLGESSLQARGIALADGSRPPCQVLRPFRKRARKGFPLDLSFPRESLAIVTL